MNPAIPCTLALVEHRDKPNEAALETVRDALLSLRTIAVEPGAPRQDAAPVHCRNPAPWAAAKPAIRPRLPA